MQIFDAEKELFFQTYKRIGVLVEKGEGVYLIDSNGEKYLDFITGIGVNVLGYGNQRIKRAISEQIEKYLHLSNLFVQKPQVDLARKLKEITGYKKVFFTNSGTEAIESAIKISRKWGKKFNKDTIVSFSNSFHGRTMGSLSLMDRIKYRDGFEPFLPGFVNIKFNNINELEEKINERTSAAFLEFVQGEGGIVPAERNFVEKIFELREKFNFLVVADEIQTGLGRTGKFFAFEHYGVKPDIVAIAKPLGGGLPLGAVLGNEKVADILTVGTHGSTFGGNPVACSAGLALIDEIISNNLIEKTKTLGKYFKSKLLNIKENFPHLIRDIRCIGLMIGIEMTFECFQLVQKMLEKKIVVNCTNNNVIRLLPPFTIEREHIDIFIQKFEEVLNQLKQNNMPEK